MPDTIKLEQEKILKKIREHQLDKQKNPAVIEIISNEEIGLKEKIKKEIQEIQELFKDRTNKLILIGTITFSILWFTLLILLTTEPKKIKKNLSTDAQVEEVTVDEEITRPKKKQTLISQKTDKEKPEIMKQEEEKWWKKDEKQNPENKQENKNNEPAKINKEIINPENWNVNITSKEDIKTLIELIKIMNRK